jgi:hypothetical protein
MNEYNGENLSVDGKTTFRPTLKEVQTDRQTDRQTDGANWIYLDPDAGQQPSVVKMAMVLGFTKTLKVKSFLCKP